MGWAATGISDAEYNRIRGFDKPQLSFGGGVRSTSANGRPHAAPSLGRSSSAEVVRSFVRSPLSDMGYCSLVPRSEPVWSAAFDIGER